MTAAFTSRRVRRSATSHFSFRWPTVRLKAGLRGNKPLTLENVRSDQGVLLRAVNLTKIFSGRAEEIVVFRDLNLEVARGEMIAITGESGVGKSTLLHLLGGLDRPTSGSVKVGEFDIAKNAELDL